MNLDDDYSFTISISNKLEKNFLLNNNYNFEKFSYIKKNYIYI